VRASGLAARSEAARAALPGAAAADNLATDFLRSSIWAMSSWCSLTSSSSMAAAAAEGCSAGGSVEDLDCRGRAQGAVGPRVGVRRRGLVPAAHVLHSNQFMRNGVWCIELGRDRRVMLNVVAEQLPCCRGARCR
jgi:hypothetical protein